MVIMNIGCGVFDYIRDKRFCKCPMCRKFVEPVLCGFNRCYYTFMGEK